MDNLINNELQKEFKPEAKKILHRFFESKYFKWLRKPLVLILIIHYLLGFISVKSGLVNINFDIFKKSNLNLSGVQQIGNYNQVNVLAVQSQCAFKYCSDFRDGKWKNIEQFIHVQENSLILKSPSNPIKPGATMYYDQEVGHFTMEVFVTPLATSSANLVLAYGNLTRCIIGDGNYSSVSCQINESYPKEPREWTYFDKDGSLHGKFSQWQLTKFEPSRELQVRYEYKNMDGNNLISIKINDQVPLTWKIPKKFQDVVQLDKVGIGLFTTKYDDVQAVFKSFHLDPNL